jgi:hypothetical protein
VGHVACMGQKSVRSVCRKTEGKRPLGGIGSWEDNIIPDLKEVT